MRVLLFPGDNDGLCRSIVNALVDRANDVRPLVRTHGELSTLWPARVEPWAAEAADSAALDRVIQVSSRGPEHPVPRGEPTPERLRRVLFIRGTAGRAKNNVIGASETP